MPCCLDVPLFSGCLLNKALYWSERGEKGIFDEKGDPGQLINQREQGGCFHGLHESQVSWNTTAIRHPLPGTKPAGTWSPAAWWGWILLFISAVRKCKKCSLSVGKGRTTPSVLLLMGAQHHPSWMLRASLTFFWRMGGIFWFSLLCSL